MGMRTLIKSGFRGGVLLFVAIAGVGQTGPQILPSNTTESLRGVSVVSDKIAWASGTHGTYLRTSDGRLWVPDQVVGAEGLDFRGVVAFSADEAFLMAAGPGDQSRIYHSGDAGRHWQLQYSNTNPQGFFDCMVFWDRRHGIVLGDPIPDEAGKLKFELLITEDGQSWRQIPAAQLPLALEGEGAFAASNSCLAILPRKGGPSAAPGPSALEEQDANIWFATGGKAARVFHSADHGHSWQVFDTPIMHGPDSAGIFSIAFRDANHGVIAGGDYKHPEQDGPNLAFTSDGGKTWSVSKIFPQSYYSAVAYDGAYASRVNSQTRIDEGHAHQALHKSEAHKKDQSENESPERLFLAGSRFIYDFRPPRNPTRISPGRKSDLQFNAISPFSSGGALVVGPRGSIATVP